MINGVVEAGNIDAVASQLLNISITPIDITEKQSGENTLTEIWEKLNTRKPGLIDLIMFSRQMYSLMRAGVPMIRALTGIIQVSKNRILTDVFKDIQHLYLQICAILHQAWLYPALLTVMPLAPM